MWVERYKQLEVSQVQWISTHRQIKNHFLLIYQYNFWCPSNIHEYVHLIKKVRFYLAYRFEELMVKMIIHMRPPVCGAPFLAAPLCGRGYHDNIVWEQQSVNNESESPRAGSLQLCYFYANLLGKCFTVRELSLLWGCGPRPCTFQGSLSWDSHHLCIATLGAKLLAHQPWRVKPLPTMEAT